MEFAGVRAKLYDNLEWAKEASLIGSIVELGRFQPTDKVLDVGTGTGIMANAITPLVQEVTGVDISRSMLALNHTNGNFKPMLGDIRDSGLATQYFDKVVARQVFHHILDRTQDAVYECHRVLKLGGLMILAEGVPPTLEIKPHFLKVFSIKEERITFMEEDLVRLLQNSGFQDICLVCVWQRQMSIRNWLDNSGLPKDKKDKIFSLYPEYEGLCKRAYNMTVTDDDFLIDMKQAIVIGRKGYQ